MIDLCIWWYACGWLGVGIHCVYDENCDRLTLFGLLGIIIFGPIMLWAEGMALSIQKDFWSRFSPVIWRKKP